MQSLVNNVIGFLSNHNFYYKLEFLSCQWGETLQKKVNMHKMRSLKSQCLKELKEYLKVVQWKVICNKGTIMQSLHDFVKEYGLVKIGFDQRKHYVIILHQSLKHPIDNAMKKLSSQFINIIFYKNKLLIRKKCIKIVYLLEQTSH